MSDMESQSIPMPGEFLAEVRDAITHLYDYAHLAGHPLALRLRARLGADASVATHSLRRTLLEHIEALRPPENTPPKDAAWRPYAMLYHRYVLGQELDEVERELNLGRRQLQREQLRALRAVALSLWAQCGALAAKGEPPQVSEELLQEISRAATEQQQCDVWEQFQSALEAVSALAHAHGVALQAQEPQARLHVRADPALFRQLLVGSLSFAVRWAGAQRLTVTAQRALGDVVCVLSAEPAASPKGETQPDALPETLTYLAEVQGARLSQHWEQGKRMLKIGLPLARPDRTVLVIEDNPDLVALYNRYVEGHGYRLIVESDSSRALHTVAEIMPDAVLLDVMMRDVDGWQILKRLKQDPALQHIPVAMCSVLDERELASSLGAAAYLRKPIRPAQLLECLRSLLPL
jgi:CheY-like chemotaxis protein